MIWLDSIIFIVEIIWVVLTRDVGIIWVVSKGFWNVEVIICDVSYVKEIVDGIIFVVGLIFVVEIIFVVGIIFVVIVCIGSVCSGKWVGNVEVIIFDVSYVVEIVVGIIIFVVIVWIGCVCSSRWVVWIIYSVVGMDVILISLLGMQNVLFI